MNWGIVGAGGIAKVFCNGLTFSKTGRLAAVASRSIERADALADLFAVEKRYASYADLYADPAIDAVYVSTIHPAHEDAVVAAAKAGKHILVEKPIGMNVAEAERMIAAARKHDVFLMEAFMYRCHPQMTRLRALIQEGEIGEVLMVRSVFGFHAPFNPQSRTYDKQLGGGGILDVGCYPASLTRYIAGAAAGRAFLHPTEFSASGVKAPTGVDLYTAATLKFENDIVAEIVTAIGCDVGSDTVIYGSEGRLIIPNPWLPSSPSRRAQSALPADTPIPPSVLWLERPGQDRKEITIEADRDLFAYEADMVGEHISERQAPACSWDDTISNMKLLEAWLSAVGVDYA